MTKLTAKDFVTIAEVIADLDLVTVAERRSMAEKFADKLAATNELFDRKRFIDAAMGEPQSARDISRA